MGLCVWERGLFGEHTGRAAPDFRTTDRSYVFPTSLSVYWPSGIIVGFSALPASALVNQVSSVIDLQVILPVSLSVYRLFGFVIGQPVFRRHYRSTDITVLSSNNQSFWRGVIVGQLAFWHQYVYQLSSVIVR